MYDKYDVDNLKATGTKVRITLVRLKGYWWWRVGMD
jgi:hypothetical protein